MIVLLVNQKLLNLLNHKFNRHNYEYSKYNINLNDLDVVSMVMYVLHAMRDVGFSKRKMNEYRSIIETKDYESALQFSKYVLDRCNKIYNLLNDNFTV